MEGIGVINMRMKIGGKRKVIKFIGVLKVIREIDDGNWEDLIECELEWRERIDGEKVRSNRKRIMNEEDEDESLKERRRIKRRRKGIGILREIGVEFIKIIKEFVIKNDMKKSGKRSIGSEGRIRIGNMDLEIIRRVKEIGKEIRLIKVIIGENIGVIKKEKRKGIKKESEEEGNLRMFFGKIIKMVENRRFILKSKKLGRGMKVRVESEWKKDIGIRIERLGKKFRIGLEGRKEKNIEID